MKIANQVETASPRNPRIVSWVMLGLAALTLTVFWRATECGFINYDDPAQVTENRYVQQGLTVDSLRQAFTSRCINLWIPLTMLSHMLGWQLYQDNPAGHHLLSVLLHTANTLLLFLVLRRMTGNVWRSAFVAAFFGLHPLHVETVTWISERKGVLSTLFWLLTLYAYAGYTRNQAQGLKTRAVRSYAASLLLFAAGLMAKPTLMTLPFVLLLLDYWPLERWKSQPSTPTGTPLPESRRPWAMWGWLVAEKIPFMVLAVVSSLTSSDLTECVLTLNQRIGNALVSYPRYLWKTLWPAVLAIPYPHPWNWPVWQVILAAVFLVVTTGWVIYRMRRQPYLATGWFWFLGTLVPTIGLIRMGLYSMADRYTYVSHIGLFLMVAWAIGEAVARRGRWKPAAAGLTAMVAATVLALCAWRAHDQIGYWSDSGTLFSHTLAVTRDNCYANISLGYYLQSKGHLDDAMRHYTEALRIWPQCDMARNNLNAVQTYLNRQKKP